MVRRVANDEWTVSRAAESYGFSRVSFYETQKAIEHEGLAGLIPRKRGPKTAHKLTDEVMGFVERQLEKDPGLRAPAIVDLLEEAFGFTIHPRSIERALEIRKKNEGALMKPNRPAGCDAELLRSGYEQLRRDALGGSVNEYMRGKGFALVLRHGMFAWILAWSECAVVDSDTENERKEADRYLVPEDIRYRTAVLLATMALHARKEVRSI